MNILLILFFALLTGCASTQFIPVKQKVNVDPVLLESCTPFVDLSPQPSYEWQDILDNLGENAIIFKKCSDKHQLAVEIIKKLTK